MTAVLLDDVDVVPRIPVAPMLTLAPTPKQTPKRVQRAPAVGGDPMVDMAARLLSIPLRHVYAALWRVGLIEVR
jgi:hypothetical protein